MEKTIKNKLAFALHFTWLMDPSSKARSSNAYTSPITTSQIFNGGLKTKRPPLIYLRFMATAIDWTIIGLTLLFTDVLTPISLIIHRLGMRNDIFSLAFICFYFGGTCANCGASPGKAFLSLSIIDPVSQLRIGWFRAIARELLGKGGFITLIYLFVSSADRIPTSCRELSVLGFSFLFASLLDVFLKSRRQIHDYLFGTSVISTGRPTLLSLWLRRMKFRQ